LVRSPIAAAPRQHEAVCEPELRSDMNNTGMPMDESELAGGKISRREQCEVV
jgi:hypothetical protein